MNIPEFQPFPKIPRLSRDCTITEKIDGTNASILITDDGGFFTGSRTRWISPEDDNYGFARWAYEHREELMQLGVGHHFGEWWGKGIQRNYSQTEKKFSLFNTHKWKDARPACCGVVPVLYEGPIDSYGVMSGVKLALKKLVEEGSVVAPGFMKPEGIVVYHHALGGYFKKTLDKDDEWKGKQ